MQIVKALKMHVKITVMIIYACFEVQDFDNS